MSVDLRYNPIAYTVGVYAINLKPGLKFKKFDLFKNA
jgi:hypothetical protein